MTNNEAIALLEGAADRAADRADIMLEMAMLTPTTARAIAELLKEQEKRINELEKKLRLLDTYKLWGSTMMPVT